MMLVFWMILSFIIYIIVGSLFVTFLRCGELSVWPDEIYYRRDNSEYGFVLYLWPVWLFVWAVYAITWPFMEFFSWLPKQVYDMADKICMSVHKWKYQKRLKKEKWSKTGE